MLSRLTLGILAGILMAAILMEIACSKRIKHHGKKGVGAAPHNKGKRVQGMKFRSARSRPKPQQQTDQPSQWQPRWRKRPGLIGLSKVYNNKSTDCFHKASRGTAKRKSTRNLMMTKAECEAVTEGCGPERKEAVEAASAKGAVCKLR